MLGLIYKLHKWIGVGIGLVLGMWLISGIVLATFPERPPRPPATTLDLSRATLSPAEAARVAGGDVEEIDLIRILDVPVYRVSTASGSTLVDARDGSHFVVTDSVARAIAMGAVGRSDVIRVDEFGAGAGYHVAFSGGSKIVAEVSSADGSAKVSDSRGRFRRTMGNLHSFRALDGMLPGRNTYTGVLVLAALISIVCVITGYAVVLPRRQRARSLLEP